MTIVFLNGCTSAGKSSIVHELQARSPSPYLRYGIDDAFGMLPHRLHDHPEGFFFDRDRRGLVRLHHGPFGAATLLAHIRAAVAIAESGNNLILDEVVIWDHLRQEWQACLGRFDTFWVGVHCAFHELERRELQRGDRLPGQARGQIDLVHRGMRYDLEIDTTETSPAVCADAILTEMSRRAC